MIACVRGSVLALMAAGFYMALGAPAQAGCVGLSGTADGFDKDSGQSRSARSCRLRQAVQGGKETYCRHRERHARLAATLLAQQRQPEHVLLQYLVRHLQARHSERALLHHLLARGGIALRLHLWRKGLLVGPSAISACFSWPL